MVSTPGLDCTSKEETLGRGCGDAGACACKCFWQLAAREFFFWAVITWPSPPLLSSSAIMGGRGGNNGHRSPPGSCRLQEGPETGWVWPRGQTANHFQTWPPGRWFRWPVAPTDSGAGWALPLPHTGGWWLVAGGCGWWLVAALAAGGCVGEADDADAARRACSRPVGSATG
jgi:hypothetical protein